MLNAALARYRTAGVLVDTNLLLLYVIGAHDRDRISRFKRTAQFTPRDFDILVRVLDSFARVFTTAHILTEVSNLAGHLPEAEKAAVFERFAAQIALLSEFEAPANEVSTDPAFIRFGLTDAGILQKSPGNCVVLTDDFRLSQYLASREIDVFNFNHLRTYLME